MSTIKCPFCKKQINSNLSSCPNCNVHIKTALEFNSTSENNNKPKHNPNAPTCPKCGSTAVTTGAKGWSLMSGLLGSNKTVNRCGNCGHTWKPTAR